MKIGVLLLNLGTPISPTKANVRRYLKEFLSDPRVLDIPWLLRKILLYTVILPFRSRKSSKAYRKIWSHTGSPLLYHSINFKNALAASLGENYHVALGMRYAEPNIQNATKELAAAQCKKIIILPLFPQYSSAASGSAIQAALNIFSDWQNIPELQVLPAFYFNPNYQKILANMLQEAKNAFAPEFILFSYHGLPERQLTKAGCHPQNCDRIAPCLQQQPNLNICYRAQCFATTEAIAKQIQLPTNLFATTFQSRLGRIQWIRPYTDLQLKNLIEQGIKRLLIVCPSFVVDCLETLEEIGIRAKEQWLQLGGEALQIVSCLNDHPDWVRAATKMITANSNLDPGLSSCDDFRDNIR